MVSLNRISFALSLMGTFAVFIPSIALADYLVVTGDVDLGAGTHNFDNNTIAGNGTGIGINNQVATATITTEGDITTSRNEGDGIFSGSQRTLNIIGDGSDTLTTSYNTGHGIELTSRSTLNIEDMNVIISNNSRSGLYIAGGSVVNISSSSSNSLNVHRSSWGDGLVTTGANSKLTLTNMNVDLSNNQHGLHVDPNTWVVMNGNGTNTLVSNNNNEHALFTTGSNAKLDIYNMDISINDQSKTNVNGAGIKADIGSVMNISSDDSNTMIIKDGNRGIDVTSTGSSLTISNYDITVTGSTNSGIRIYDEASAAITGNGSNNLTSNQNGWGLYLFNSSEANIADMNIELNGNTNEGMVLYDGSTAVLTGSSSDVNTLVANSNYAGIDITNSSLTISNYDITATGNTASGLNVSTGASAVVTGSSSNANTLVMNDNDRGINVDNSSLTISDYDIMATGNTASGLRAYGGASVTITGDGSQTMNLSQNGYGLYLWTDATFSIANMDIEINNNTNEGILLYDNSKASIVGLSNGSNTLTANNNDYAIDVEGIGSAFDISNMDVTLNDNGVALYADAGGTIDIIGRALRNSLTMNGSTWGTAVNSDGTSSAVTITNMNIFTDTDFGLASDSGKISLNNSDIMVASGKSLFTLDNGLADVLNGSEASTTDTVAFDVTGGAGNVVTVSNSDVSGGNGQFLYGSGSSTSNLNATASNLTGSINKDVGSTVNATLNNSNWYMKQSSALDSLTGTGSTNISLASGTPGVYNTLTVSDYNVNGTVWMNANPDASGLLSDQIVILNGGQALGSTLLRIANDGSSGGGNISNEIKLVDAQGTAQTYNTFNLYGGMVDLGAHTYYLEKGGLGGTDDESWFLRNTGQLNNAAATITNEPAVLANMVRAGVNSLNRRMGELRDNSYCDDHGAWVRTYARDMKISDFVDTSYSLYGIEAGYDHRLDTDSRNQYYVGAMIGYMQSGNVRHEVKNGALDGTGDIKAPSVGLYATWLNYDGWFADATLRSFLVDMSLTSYTAAGTPVTFNPDRQITSLSLEVGKQFTHEIDRYTKWLFEPKAEIIGMTARAGNYTSSTGNKLEIGDTSTVMSKIAMMIAYHKTFSNRVTTFSPFIQVGLINDYNGKTDINYDGTSYQSNLRGSGAEFKTGINMQMTSSTSFYSEFSYEFGPKIRALDANIGLRHTW